jgi:predicted Zn-dependent protease
VTRPWYLPVSRSFHRLTEAERQQAKPQRIKLIPATANTRFEQLARHSAISNQPEAQLRLLNDIYPRGEPQPGERIKVVE